MHVRQHKFIDTTNNEEVYHLIDYTDESEYAGKVLEVIETVRDVAKFWDNCDFDLRLPGIKGKTPLGNCDLCFLKGKNTIMNIMKNYPEKAQWWMDQEKKQLGDKSKDGFVFRHDRPDYKTMLEISKSLSLIHI